MLLEVAFALLDLPLDGQGKTEARVDNTPATLLNMDIPTAH